MLIWFAAASFLIVALVFDSPAVDRRLLGRRAVGLPIGLFLHLVLDGTWLTSSLFWWPFGGGSPLGRGRIPEFDHLAQSLVLEVVGIAIAVLLIRRYELTDSEHRRQFVRSGRLPRAAMKGR
jgi:hypothetical protein